jgi:hypothetical protein
VNNWSTSKTSFMNLTLPTFVTFLFLSNVIQKVSILIKSLNWSPKVGMITSRNVPSKDKFMDKSIYFQNVDKWCQEWSQPCHMNATYKGFAKLLDHVWSCESCCWLDNYGLSCVRSCVL